MGKIKLGSDCYLSADILTEVFQKYLLSGPLLFNIYCLSKPPNFVSCHGNQNAIFGENI